MQIIDLHYTEMSLTSISLIFKTGHLLKGRGQGVKWPGGFEQQTIGKAGPALSGSDSSRGTLKMTCFCCEILKTMEERKRFKRKNP